MATTERPKAPYKRGTKLSYTGVHHPHGEVTYVAWWGIQRAALIRVRFSDGVERTVHVDEVKPL